MMWRYGYVLTLIALIATASSVDAVDLNGRWRFESGAVLVVEVTQAGSALSIPFGLPFTGTVGATDANGFTSYSVSWSDGINQAGFGGRVTPSGNLLDGRGGSFFPPNPPAAAGVVATRCTCFDGNSVDGDGCDATCQVEPCWSCAGDPSVCTPTMDGGACEDGSPCTSGETCTAGACAGGAPIVPCFDLNGDWTRHRAIPDLAVASHTPTTIVQRGTDLRIDSYVGSINLLTGNFDVRAPSLDLFCAPFSPLVGSVALDGLTYTGVGTIDVPQPFAPDHCDTFALSEIGDHCGNGALEGTEACDDGNLVDGDGCTTQCGVETCWTCTGAPSACMPAAGGSCDDGNGCTINDTCTAAGACAGTADTGASCDDGSACTTADACAADGRCTGAPVDCGQCQVCDGALGCVVQPGASCDDGDACTTGDFCSNAGTCAGAPLTCEPCFACAATVGCVLEPRPVCKMSTDPTKSMLYVKDAADDNKDKLLWRWNKGEATTPSELSNPPAGDAVTLCVYDESGVTPGLLFRASIPTNSLWKETATGYSFKDPDAGTEGVSVAQLKSGDSGKARAKVKGKGTHLSDHAYGLPAPAVPLPLRVQLQGENGMCFETRHAAGAVIKNEPGLFKARGTP